MSEDSGAGTQPGSCGPQEGIPGASLDSSGSGRGPGSLMSSRPVARRRNRYSGSSSGDFRLFGVALWGKQKSVSNVCSWVLLLWRGA
eukprot:scaffold6618_cov139-Isochrysis_galbana.AAC.9